jgi:electron transfer flavoprotein beta subunit
MKVIVGIKRVVDPYVKVRVRADGSGVDLANAKMAINPFCEIAVEEAIRMKEAGTASEVIVVSVGPFSGARTVANGISIRG